MKTFLQKLFRPRSSHSKPVEVGDPSGSHHQADNSRTVPSTAIVDPDGTSVKRVDLNGPSVASGLSSAPNASYRGPDATVTAVSLLAGANGFELGTLNYTNVSHSTTIVGDMDARASKGWDMLVQNTAPNALLDSSALFDPPRCDEDTRREVIGDIMDWVYERETPNRILCMTGAAGAGKSALQQTVAEECQKLNIFAASFFFSSSDASRNVVSRVIPTIAYQLGLLHPNIRSYIGRSVDNDPLIFNKSLNTQAAVLITAPIQGLGKDQLKAIPFLIFIDGLGECSDEDHQRDLLIAFRKSIAEDGDHFRLFIASRPEWAIRSALEDGGHLHAHASYLRLSDDYDASNDIRLTLRTRLREIGSRSGGFRAREPTWPSPEDVESLVSLASGQYIFAKTVIRYVSERRSSPVERLKAGLSWTADGSNTIKPFAALDILYKNVLSSAIASYEATEPMLPGQFLLLLRSYAVFASHPGTPVEERGSYIPRGLCMMERAFGIQEGTYEADSPVRQDFYTPWHCLWGWMTPRLLHNIAGASCQALEKAAAHAHSDFPIGWGNFDETVIFYSLLLFSLMVRPDVWANCTSMVGVWVRFTERGRWENMDKIVSTPTDVFGLEWFSHVSESFNALRETGCPFSGTVMPIAALTDCFHKGNAHSCIGSCNPKIPSKMGERPNSNRPGALEMKGDLK
ncbi:hypothetical protein NMY22_g6776 [Coprinellus aureogranulatus]|nr:hypothetical protein NMY22_g6776 [Coprinellus aureogranulatus]